MFVSFNVTTNTVIVGIIITLNGQWRDGYPCKGLHLLCTGQRLFPLQVTAVRIHLSSLCFTTCNVRAHAHTTSVLGQEPHLPWTLYAVVWD
jgi:hypothetical protein